MIVGRVDDLKNSKIFGWAYSSEVPEEHLVIRVSRGTQTVASGVANIFREDLREAGVGEGDHAFEILMPPNIESFHGLMIVAQSQKSGEMALQIATNDDRRLDELVSLFSRRYEDALLALKEEIDRLKERLDTLESGAQAPTVVEVHGDEGRMDSLESRLESAEVFVLRIDEAVRKLTETQKKPRRKRFFGLF